MVKRHKWKEINKQVKWADYKPREDLMRYRTKSNTNKDGVSLVKHGFLTYITLFIEG